VLRRERRIKHVHATGSGSPQTTSGAEPGGILSSLGTARSHSYPVGAGQWDRILRPGPSARRPRSSANITWQIHNLSSTTSRTIDLAEWDGAAEMRFRRPSDWTPSPHSVAYHARVIVPDEKRFLVSEALEHILRVDEGTVLGERRVIIEGGRAVVEVDPEAVKRWKEFDENNEVEGS
jgi:hypothetical protein